MIAASIPRTVAEFAEPSELTRRVARRTYGLSLLRFWHPHTYQQRAWAHGLQPDVEPADMAQHEVANAMTAELLGD